MDEWHSALQRYHDALEAFDRYITDVLDRPEGVQAVSDAEGAALCLELRRLRREMTLALLAVPAPDVEALATKMRAAYIDLFGDLPETRDAFVSLLDDAVRLARGAEGRGRAETDMTV